MVNKLLKFDCSICGKENWVELTENRAKGKKYLIYCCNCGKVFETTKRIVKDFKGNSCCECIPFTGIESKSTTGPIKSRTGETRWGAGGEDYAEEEYMQKFGQNPMIDWCSVKENQNKDECKRYSTRCQDMIKPISFKQIVLDPNLETHNGPIEKATQ